MKLINSRLLLAVYLILVGITSLFGVRLGEVDIVMPILALASGILMVMGK